MYDIIDTILKYNSHGVIILDNNYVIKKYNKYISNIFGYNANELVGKNIKIILSNDIIQIDFHKKYEFKSKHKNKKEICIELSKQKIKNKEKTLIIVYILNLSVLHNRYKLGYFKYKAIIDQSPISIIITNKDGYIEYVNSKFCEITGYNNNEVYGKNPRFLKSGKHNDKFYKELWNTLNKGKTWTGEFLNKNKNGQLYWENTIISSIKSREGKTLYYVGIKDDITQKKENEIKLIEYNLKLIETNKKIKLKNIEILLQNKTLKDYRKKIEKISAELDKVVNSSNAIIIEIDKNFNILRWNKTISKISGILSSKIINKNLNDLYILGSFKELLKNIIKQYINNKSKENYEINIISINKTIHTLLLSINIKYDNKNRISGFFIVGQDITELSNYKKMLEVKVRERTKELTNALIKQKELLEYKSKFISIISHEYRTPLTTINFIADFIKNYFDRLSKIQIVDKLENIQRQIGFMTNLLNDILIYEKTRSNKYRIKFEKVDLDIFFKDLIDEVYITTNRTHKINYKQNITKVEILIDINLFRNIFINLLTNAIKFSLNSDIVEIEVEILKKKIIINIIDYGIGIKDIDEVFELYNRGENAQNIKGTGIGLNIVKESIKKYQGEIKVHTKLGKGSRFEVTLPIKKQ